MEGGGSRKGGSEPPFQGGSQPVPQNPEEVPTRGRSVVQTVVIVVAVLAAVAAILWIVVPFTG